MEWGGLLRKMRTQDSNQGQQAPPAEGGATVKGAGRKAPAAPASAAGEQTARAAPPSTATKPATMPLIPRRTWASGAFLAAAARLVARGEEATYTLRRVVEWATAATGACHAVLWAIDGPVGGEQPLTLLAWAATDGWQPSDDPPPQPQHSPAIMRALRTPETLIVDLSTPAEQGVAWSHHLGLTPIALCAAISSGEPRGILVVAGLGDGSDPASVFGEDARAALAACAALAAIVFERRETDHFVPIPTAIEEEPAPEPAAEPPDAFQSLPDHATMVERLRLEVGRARRFGHPLAVLNLDVDRFEEWSAQAGEVVAAIALAHLTTIISESIREVDLLGRGEEDSFIIILPVSEVDDALRVGERIRSTLARRQPNWPVVGGANRLTLSGGAVGHPDDGTTAEELLAAAERTTAYAKRMGRDQIRMRGLGEMESPGAQSVFQPTRGGSSNLHGVGVGQIFQGLIDALSTAGDAHDQARPGHGRAVGRYARALAEACGLGPEQAQIIELAGVLHDAGKIGLPADILGKRGALSIEERAILREQPAVGKLMLLQVASLEAVVPLVEHAHERFDGGGYPSGLRGNQIPFGSRIIAIAEGYEAMTSDRPYRQALSHSMAVAELWREAGGRYDPRLIDVFVRLVGAQNTAQEKEDWNPNLLERVVIAPAPAPAQPDASVSRAEVLAAGVAPAPAPAAPVATAPIAAAPTREAPARQAPATAAMPQPPAPQREVVAPATPPSVPAPAPDMAQRPNRPTATGPLHTPLPMSPAPPTKPIGTEMAPARTGQITPSAPPGQTATPAAQRGTPAPEPTPPVRTENLERGQSRLLQRRPPDTMLEAPQPTRVEQSTDEPPAVAPTPVQQAGPPASAPVATSPWAETFPAAPTQGLTSAVWPESRGGIVQSPTTDLIVDTPAGMAAGAVAMPEEAPALANDGMVVWYDDEPGFGDSTMGAIPEEDGDADDDVQSLSLTDTLLVQSETSLLRIAELGRLSQRRTGFFFIDRTKEKE